MSDPRAVAAALVPVLAQDECSGGRGLGLVQLLRQQRVAAEAGGGAHDGGRVGDDVRGRVSVQLRRQLWQCGQLRQMLLDIESDVMNVVHQLIRMEIQQGRHGERVRRGPRVAGHGSFVQLRLRHERRPGLGNLLGSGVGGGWGPAYRGRG